MTEKSGIMMDNIPPPEYTRMLVGEEHVKNTNKGIVKPVQYFSASGCTPENNEPKRAYTFVHQKW